MHIDLVLRAATAMVAAALVLSVLKRNRSPDLPSPFNDLLGAVLVGMAVGRLAYLLGEGVDLIAHPIELILVRGGISPVPAAMAAIGFLAWECRSDLWRRMDFLAPAGLAGLAVWEAGCWWQDACLGSPSGLPWAMALPGSDLTRHPVGMYAAGLLAAGAVWLLLRPLRWKGASAAAGLGWASTVRLAVPLWSVGNWSNWAWWYLLGVVLGLGGVVAARRKAEKTVTGNSPVDI